MLPPRFLFAAVLCLSLSASAWADAVVRVEPSAVGLQPGETVTVTVKVESDVPIFCYTLELKATPRPGATGSVSFDPNTSDWGDPQNLIVGGGKTRDPEFTILMPSGDDPNHLFVNTNTDDLSAVLPVEGVNDILVRVALTASQDAEGGWDIGFVDGVSVLGDDTFRPIPTTWQGTGLGVPALYTLDLTVVNPQYGTVDVDPNLPDYVPATEVTLTATPIEGKAFKRWRVFDPNYPGDMNHATDDSNLVLTLLIDQDLEVEAYFECGSGMGYVLPSMLVGVLGLGLMSRKYHRLGRKRRPDSVK